MQSIVIHQVSLDPPYEKYSENEMQWKDRDIVVKTKEEEEAANKLLFTARYRTYGSSEERTP